VKRFVFRPAKLERVRDLARRASRAELARALAEGSRSRSEHEREALVLAEARSRAWAPVPVDASELKRLASWCEERAGSVARAEAAVRAADVATEAAARRHTEDARAHRVLERLREKRWGQWIDEWEREQQKLLDETHLARRAAARFRGR
jgi:hypothetical protein